DWPATGCSTFGRAERMRVPSPAASTTVRLERAAIRILRIHAHEDKRRRHNAFSPAKGRRFATPDCCGFKATGHFLLSLQVIRQALRRANDVWPRIPTISAALEPKIPAACSAPCWPTKTVSMVAVP